MISNRDLLIAVLSSFLLTSCGNVGTAKYPTTSNTNRTSAGALVSSGIPAGGASTGSSSGNAMANTTSPLSFSIDGLGNHARHVCVPATRKLIVRVMPHINMDPLLPRDPMIINARNGQLLYDGSPAYYGKLSVRLSIPGSSAAWDFQADTGTWSVKGDFSSHLRASAGETVPGTSMLSTPEYELNQTIYGSSRNDGVCTYWEKQLGRCSAISSVMRSSESAICPAGQQKILITRVISDYPCNVGDPVDWCKGGQLQIVPDYQHWMLTLQAETENTTALPSN